MEMKFINGGSIEIPPVPGGYVIAPGCGAGKTSGIIKFILEHYNEGVIYSAFTIEECNEMYRSLVRYLDSTKMNYIPLAIDDICLIHSDFSDKSIKNDINIWRHDQDLLENKKVIIMTHAKFLEANPTKIMSTSFNSVNLDYFDEFDINNRMLALSSKSGVINLPRKWVLIDELITQRPRDRFMKSSALQFLMYDIKDSGVTRIDGHRLMVNKKGFNKVREAIKPILINSLKLYGDNDAGINSACKDLSSIWNNRNDLFPIYTSDGKVTRSGNGICSEVSREMDRDIALKTSLSDYIRLGMNYYVLLFDGTGDITFSKQVPTISMKNDIKFKVLTYSNKYNSPVTLCKFPFNVKRYSSESKFIKDKEKICKELMNSAGQLYDIVKNNDKTLIVTWKNLRVNRKDDSNYQSEDLGIKPNEYNILNPEEDLKSFYEIELRARGLISGYSFIHYQSGLDKATNEFRDYDSVVFLGKFQIPVNAVEDFNSDYCTNLSLEDYTMYQLIQAICRTRIRNHKGESINIYYSSDWKDEIFNKIYNYLSYNKVCKDNTEYTKLINLNFMSNIRPKWRSAIEILCNEIPEIKIALQRNEICNCSINLSKIYELIPLYERKVKKYYPLINYLRKLGIELTINSEVNNQYTVK